MKKFLLLGCSSLILALCGPAMATWETPTDHGNSPDVTAAASSANYPTGPTYEGNSVPATGYYKTWIWHSQGVGDDPGMVNAYASYTSGDLSLALSAPHGSAYGSLACTVTVNDTVCIVAYLSNVVNNGALNTTHAAGFGATTTVPTYPNGDTLTINVDANASTSVEVSDTDPNDTASATTSEAAVYVNGTEF